MPFNFFGFYVPIECSSNEMEMAEDDHVPDNTKCMDLTEDIEAAQCAIMANVVISSEAGPEFRPVYAGTVKYLLSPFKPGKV